MAEQQRIKARTVDRIDTGPRFREADAVRLNRLFHGNDTIEMLTSVLRDGLAGDVAVVSSFGAESAVLLHLVSRIDPAIPVLFLETGKHFPETLAYRDTLVARLGLTDLRNLTSDPAELAAKDESGLRWSYDPDGCCDIRKVAPLAMAVASFDATITGRKGFQSSTRANLPRFEIDSSDAPGPPQDQSADRLEPRSHRRLCRRTRSASPSAGRRRLSLDRLLALHQQGGRRRGPARRALARLGQGRMRHSSARRTG